MVQVGKLSDKWLSRYGLLENFTAEIHFGDVLDFNLYLVAPPPRIDSGVQCH